MFSAIGAQGNSGLLITQSGDSASEMLEAVPGGGEDYGGISGCDYEDSLWPKVLARLDGCCLCADRG